MPGTYLDFDLLIEHAAQGYRAKVLDSPTGQAAADFSLPFSSQEMELFLLRLTRSLSEARRRVRRLESQERELVKGFGGQLFQAMFSGAVLGALQSSLNEAFRKDAGLRIRLRLTDTPELADIPWEFLFNPVANRFLNLAPDTPLIRYLDLPMPVRPLTVTPPLRVLVMISSPADFAQLDVAAEWDRLNAALGDLVKRGLVTITRLPSASLAGLQRPLRLDKYHIFHFIGHGGFDEQAQDGALALEDAQGRARLVTGQDLGVMLSSERSLRLVVLNACEGARAASSDPFAGVAQSLVQQGVPAVIAMQFEITDEAAITFAEQLYAAIADGYSVDAALGEARRAIFASGNDVEWATPVLYTRSPSGQLFRVTKRSEAAERLAKEQAEREAAERLAKEQAEREAAERLAKDQAEREAAEQRARDQAEREAAEQRAQDQAEREAAAATVTSAKLRRIWPRHRVAVLGGIAAVVALIVLLVALLGGDGGPGPLAGATLSPTTGTRSSAPPPASVLSRMSFAPVLARDIESTTKGTMLRLASVEGTLYAVGADGSRGAVWVSTDGATWTRKTLPPAAGEGTQLVQGIAGDETGLVAVGWEKPRGQRKSAAVWTSGDGGATWTPAPDHPDYHGTDDTWMNRVAIIRDVAIAVGRSGSDARLWTSADGRAVTNPVFDADPRHSLALRDVAEGNGVVVTVGEDALNGASRAAAWFSDDSANSWDRGTVKGGRGDSSIVSVIATGDGFIGVGYDSPQGDRDAAVWTSRDGRTWNRASTQDALREEGTQVMRGVVEIPGRGFMAVGVDDSDAAVWYSTDSRTWERSTRALGKGGNREMTGVIRTDDRLFVVGRQGRAGIWTAELPR
ncbi:MAG TPA: CHAT domain-containing protein [Actinomycetota bacterium]|nr:CHAT domain-containing protein [Actinomycetota bacterium]